MTIRVVLVDDQALVRSGSPCSSTPSRTSRWWARRATGSRRSELLERLDADVVLMDVRMPRLDGVEATSRIIAARADGPRVVVLTTFDLDEHAFAALQAGASGFLLKDAMPGGSAARVRAVHAGDAVVAPSTTRRLIERYVKRAAPVRVTTNVESLTEREHEVWLAIARGLTNGEIAAELVVSEATVKTHVGNILAKTGMRDRVALVLLAYECGAMAGD